MPLEKLVGPLPVGAADALKTRVGWYRVGRPSDLSNAFVVEPRPTGDVASAVPGVQGSAGFFSTVFVDGVRALQVFPTAAGTASLVFTSAKGGSSATLAPDLGLDPGAQRPTVAGVTPALSPLAWVWQTWARLYRPAGTEVATSWLFAGFLNGSSVGPVPPTPKVGLFGRNAGTALAFGSLNCPDGIAAGGNDGKGALDANTEAGRFDPGTRWFFLRFKFVPALPDGTPAKCGCYRDGQLVATYTLPNLPRGWNGLVQRTDLIRPAFYVGSDGSPMAGWLLADTEVWWDFDLSL